jgi:hypothetical protein
LFRIRPWFATKCIQKFQLLYANPILQN